MSKAFKNAKKVAQSLMQNTSKSGNFETMRQAQVLSQFVESMARLEKDFQIEGQQVTAALLRLQKQVKNQQVKNQQVKNQQVKSRLASGMRSMQTGELPGYYVQITGGKGQQSAYGYRAADTGLVGSRVGRGPVRMVSSKGPSTKAVTTAFAKLLSMQAQVQSIKEELEVLKKRR